MSRSVPWRTNCPQAVKDIFDRLPSCHLLLVRRIGPTSFILSGREGREKFRTSIGDPHECSCGDGQELCLHILFILCKVFFLPRENPLVWQRSLVAAEIDELLRAEKRVRNVQNQTGATGTVVPKQVEQGDVCPICFEDLCNDSPLCYCQASCGRHLHAYCFKQYKRHNFGAFLRCPYCRSLWINDPNNTSKKCCGCKRYAGGEQYICLFCQDYFLCAECFHCSDTHSNHPFSLLGARDVVERHDGRRPSRVQPIQEAPTQIPAEVLPLMYREINPNDYEALIQLDERNIRRVLTLQEFMTLKRGGWNSSFETDTCIICLESFDSNSSCVWLLCGHFFHTSCARRWLTEHSAVCPVDHSSVIVSDIEDHVAQTSSSNLPVLRSYNRRRQGNRQEPAVNSVVSRRTVRTISRRIERPRAASTVSLPPIELQVLSLGHLQRREGNSVRFCYGGA
ncbi:hypothetical protein C3747_31g242 [Trypanosoma cruzi]|uniref:RING-type domain-containing protein n=1 Tax=Trypanosoma cruzi TaxID=5693 RepID=A0A2V2X300_TRYCR|nr:hypothetical protein ECC02_007801 [Trypanosoma cruzi]KAF8299575.1 putative Ring finger domain containing protein [Trypanosoma cruzi]PWV15111.1 hypothetical protein C3747_31g242 [Trypanosoma cruzi]